MVFLCFVFFTHYGNEFHKYTIILEHCHYVALSFWNVSLSLFVYGTKYNLTGIP